MFQERNTRPRRAKPAERLALFALARLLNWREVLVIVKVATFIGWHRTEFRAFWRWKSRKPGRPSLPENLRELIRQMAAANPSWGEERIADEPSLKLCIHVSPRTVGKHLDSCSPHGRTPDQHWGTFVRNHAKGIVACDFMVSVTASM
jgi:putative transposase